jgi:hypothetical protein
VTGTAYQSIGFVNVQETRDRVGAAVYIAKYIVKPWPAVPAWIGNSTRQLRKYRLSNRSFEWLESRGRHVRKRGARSVHRRVVQRRKRTVYQRMASSESAMSVFTKCGGKLKFKGQIALPRSAKGLRVLEEVDPRLLLVGRRVSYLVSAAQVGRLRRANAGGAMRTEFMQERLRDLSSSWERYQLHRAEEEERAWKREHA